jgi:hypothetical protein
MRASITRRRFGAALLCAAGMAGAPAAAGDGRAWAQVAAVSDAPTNQGLELVMVERAGCAWCARWNAEIAPIYPKTPEGAQAPLRRHDLGAGQPPQAATPTRFTPTFLLLRDGREVGRITGYVDQAMFWGLLAELLAKAGAKT